jgi:hypothetical protein
LHYQNKTKVLTKLKIKIMTNLTLQEIINKIVSNIKADLSSNNEEKKEKAFNITLKAYNAYQDNERNSVDYIFDANNVEDCKTLTSVGTTLKEYHDAVMASEIKSDYFFCGVNHPQITFLSKTQLFAQIWGNLEDVIKHAMIQPYIDGYNQLYHKYISYILYEKLILDEK